MNYQLSENKLRKLRILIAPLDWGLGHATRCIPIIKELLNQNCEVYLAGDGAQKTLLETEFPSLPLLLLKGYHIYYSRKKWAMPLHIFFQVPKILSAIRQEKKWLRFAVNEYKFDVIISDNRYGLHSPKAHSIFITHQLLIKSPVKWIEKIFQKRNYNYINQFDECWVPDNKNENNLSGELSHPSFMPAIPVKYIGWLSRMKVKAIEPQKNHLLIMLSGPEPQRSILENKIIDQIVTLAINATIVRGIPEHSSIIPSTNSIKFYNHLSTEELNTEMAKADLIIARSGYTTVMEIVSMKKKSILIPTPGQTEQEYLANYLFQKRIAYCCAQKYFSLKKILENVSDFSYQFLDKTESGAELIIENLISSVQKRKITCIM